MKTLTLRTLATGLLGALLLSGGLALADPPQDGSNSEKAECLAGCQDDNNECVKICKEHAGAGAGQCASACKEGQKACAKDCQEPRDDSK